MTLNLDYVDYATLPIAVLNNDCVYGSFSGHENAFDELEYQHHCDGNACWC